MTKERWSETPASETQNPYRTPLPEQVKRIDGLDDATELNFYIRSHSGGEVFVQRFTVGEFKKSHLHDYDPADEGDQDDYRIEVVTPEVQAEEDKAEETSADIEALTALGVDPRLFFPQRGDERRGRHGREREGSVGGRGRRLVPEKPELTPEKLLEYAKIVEKYLAEKKG